MPLSHEIIFSIVFKIMIRKMFAKAKYLKSENSFKNLVIIVFQKWLKILIFKVIQS